MNVESLRTALEKNEGQLALFEKQELINHGIESPETLIRMAYIGEIANPYLSISGGRLTIYTSVYYALSQNQDPVLFHFGHPPMSYYPYRLEVPDFTRRLVSKEGIDYGFAQRYLIGDKKVLERGIVDEVYGKHIRDFYRYSQIIGTS